MKCPTPKLVVFIEFTIFFAPDILRSLGSSCLGSLCAVLGTSLISLGNSLSVQCSSDDVVTAAGEILDSSASDKNNGVFLKVMSDTGNVSGYFLTVGELYSGDLSHSRVRLFGGSRSYCGAYSSFLRGTLVGRYLLFGVESFLKSGGCGFLFKNISALAYQLIKGWHIFTPFAFIMCKAFQRQFYTFVNYTLFFPVCQ